MFENFSRKRKQEGPPVEVGEVRVVAKELTTGVKNKKTFKEVQEAKNELSALQEDREEKIKNLRNQKDEIRKLGVAEFKDEFRPVKRTETFNDLVAESERGLAEISEKIGSIREEFDFNPKHVDILEERKARVGEYITYIEGKLLVPQRDFLKKMNSFFGEDLSKIWVDNRNTEVFIESLKSETEKLPEVQTFLDLIEGVSGYDKPDIVKDALEKLKHDVNENIKINSVYQTEGEIKEAYDQMNRGVRLMDNISKTLTEAKNKEGRFVNKKESGLF